jgi:hypothetical protein
MIADHLLYTEFVQRSLCHSGMDSERIHQSESEIMRVMGKDSWSLMLYGCIPSFKEREVV